MAQSSESRSQVPQEEPTLAEFLVARIDDDRAAANEEIMRKRGTARLRRWDGPFDPWRTLAECDAKRGIVIRYLATRDLTGEGGVAAWLHLDLRSLAAVYADHPDYRQEWSHDRA